MEDVLELILSILFIPFESKYEALKNKINSLPHKSIKIFIKVLLIIIPFAFIFGVCCLCSYIFRGHWL